MASIRISTDVETAKNYVRAFQALGRRLDIRVRVEGAAPPFVVPPLIRPRGIDFLLDVGRACARPHVQDDPAQLFALLRYATAISSLPPFLALAEPVASLDQHKKMVLSDEFGCGLALTIGRELFGAEIFFDFHDVTEWGWVRTHAERSRRPDYVGLCADGTLVVLEAKGTQSGQSYCRRTQIPSGLEQLEAVDLKSFSGGIKAGIVVGAVLRHVGSGGPSLVVLGVPHAPPAKGRGFACDLELPEEQLFLRAHFARLAAFSGDEDLLDRLAPRRPSRAPGSTRLVAKRTVGGASFTGNELIVEGGGRRLVVFVGLEDEIRTRLLASEFGTSRESTIELLADARSRLPASAGLVSVTDGPDLRDSEFADGGELDAVSDEGLAVIVNIETD